jgi:hypothetical protein
MDANMRAAVDEDGFGGHTALFGTVVSQPNFWMNYQEGREQVAPFTELLLKHGADPNARGSLRKKLHEGYGPKYDVENTYEYRDVTPIGWGRQFHAKVFVSEPAKKSLVNYHLTFINCHLGNGFSTRSVMITTTTASPIDN